MALTISPDRRSFVRDGRPFFYLADTMWSAFTNPTLDEWRYYLAYRRRQGFTALQISILPILHDASDADAGPVPFAVDALGHWDFVQPDHNYFERAKAMVALAREAGLVPVLVVLWCNYVPDTWASKRRPEMVMPLAQVQTYVQYIVACFKQFDPIYVVSGDTDFDTPQPALHYQAALAEIKRLSPGTLTTMHLAPQADLPEEIASSPNLDFYMFQSGHHVEEPARPYAFAEHFAGKPVTRPVVNGEPPYEGHGHGNRYGRFSAFEVRRASWQSLLSGAGAGVTYGAHGIWSWHRSGSPFTSESFSGIPFDWSEALRLEGAWDLGFIRTLCEQYALFGLLSRQDLIEGPPEIRAAASANSDRIAVYVPYPREVTLTCDPAAYQWSVVDLASRRWLYAQIHELNGHAIVAMHQANADTLVVGVRTS